MTKATMYILYLCRHFSLVYTQMELLSHRVGVYLTVLEIGKQFSKVSVFPPAMHEFPCSITLTTHCIDSVFNFGQSGE
jgi:hypothetical protein